MSTAQGPVQIQPVLTARQRADWLGLPAAILSNDPHWVPPLQVLERRRFSPKSQPFFSFGEAQLLLAYRDGRAIGRISAQINRRHLAHHKDDTGQFGFFDCRDDPAAATALVEAAAAWLRSRGLRRMTGPFSFSINEEAGLLVDGFDHPPAILMGHGAPWYGALLEQAGMTKEIDLFAYRMRPSEVPGIVLRLAKLASRTGRVSVRRFDMRNYRAEIATLIDIFNDAWSDNWGFVPFSDAEIDALVSETRFLLRGKYGRILSLDGRPVGVMLALPDLNDVIAGFRGRLLPFGWARLLKAFRQERWRSARIPLLGLRKSERSTPLAPAMLALLIAEFINEARSYPLDWVEFSWVLETNRAMTTLADLAAGAPVKTCRVYGRPV